MKRHLMLGMALLWIFSLATCGGATGGTETGNATPDGVAEAVGASIDTVAGMLNTDPDFDSVAGLQFQNHSTGNIKNRFSFFSSAMAAPLCILTAECDDANHTATFIKDYSAGCDDGDNFTVEGKRQISWINMGANSCTGPTAKPSFINAIQGEGARQIRSSDSIPADGSCGTPTAPISYSFDDGSRLDITECGILDYLDFNSPAPSEGTVTESFTLPFARRTLFRPNGNKAFDHTLTTPTPLLVDLVKIPTQNRPNKIIHSGSIHVTHNIAHFSVETQYQEVQWDYNQCRCYPISGNLTFTVTNLMTGQTSGSGSLTFNKDETGSCRIAQATFQGQTLNIPLHSCRGI